MLCFVFSALVVLLDQLFKRWAVIVLAGGEDIVLIPKLVGLTYVENTGAAFGIFTDMRWPLAALQFICVLVIIAILLRYNEGFWGRLGLAAVLGGAVGNLVDRVISGYVVDMFEFLFLTNFAIFNIADIFITLGGVTFVIYYIASSAKPKKHGNGIPEQEEPLADSLPDNVYQIEHIPHPDAAYDTRPLPRPTPPPAPQPAPQPAPAVPPPEPPPEEAPIEYSALSSFSGEFSEESILEEYDLDKLLAEYGFEDDDEA